MALVTLCPECNTTFRVTSEQLKVHRGDVRCGQCHHVFNSFATLITIEESEISYVSDVPDATLAEDLDEAKTLGDFDGEPAEQSDVDAFQEENAITYFEDDFDDRFDAAPQKQKLDYRWVLANVVFLFLLLGQAVYFFRTEISAAVPATRPLLLQYCAQLNCTVPFPRDVTLLSIESSSLQANPNLQSKVTTMTATIRNYAAFPQALPAIKLSLTDTRSQLLASRVFVAADYFGDNAKLIQSIEPNQEINIRLDYDSSKLHAVGYQLFLFYP